MYKKLIAMSGAFALILTALVLTSAMRADATGGGDDCVAAKATYGEWTAMGFTPVQHGGVPAPPGPDTDTRKYVEQPTWEHELSQAYDEQVLVTPAVPAVAGVWANFSPNDQQATFVGPAVYPTDQRGTWHDHGSLPPGQAGPDGVYANGSPNMGGNWFYRKAGTPGIPATYMTVHHDAVTETDSKYTIFERTYTPAVECPPGEEEPEKKVVVCKYTGTPPGGLHHIVIVSESTLDNVEDAQGEPYVPGQFPFSWTDAHGQTQEGSIAIRYATEGEQAHEVPLAMCPDMEEPTKIELPVPTVIDGCGVGNASWNVPVDTEVFDWELVDGELIVTILTANTVFEDTNETSYNFGEVVETNTEACDVEQEELEVPAIPGVIDTCGVGNASWNVPVDTEVFDWELVDGELIVTILTANTVFEDTNETSHNFGEAIETITEECEILGEEIEVPAEPAVKDPCGAGNATWIVPADSDKLDWTLAGGVLSVEITVPDTVFPGGQDTSFSFGTAPETNTDACDVAGEQDDPPPTVEVKGEQAVVPTAVDAGLGVHKSPVPTGRNPLWLLVVGGGLGLMGSAGVRRRSVANR